MQRTLTLEIPVDLVATLSPLRRGRNDPCMALSPDEAWRATRTADGPALIHLHRADAARVVVRAWGPGRDWALDHADGLVGAQDDPSPLERMLQTVRTPERAILQRLHRHHGGLRLPRTLAVAETLTPVILEQRVTGQEAWRSYRRLVHELGAPAPVAPTGGPQLWLPPEPATLVDLPSWHYHRLGVERRRAETIVRVNRLAPRLHRAVTDPTSDRDVDSMLRSVPGVGQWTIAETARTTVGDPDAVSTGDFHLPNTVAWLFRRRARSDDDEMLRLLEPYRGQRGRVLRLVMLSRTRAPKFGPKGRILDIRSI